MGPREVNIYAKCSSCLEAAYSAKSTRVCDLPTTTSLDFQPLIDPLLLPECDLALLHALAC